MHGGCTGGDNHMAGPLKWSCEYRANCAHGLQIEGQACYEIEFLLISLPCTADLYCCRRRCELKRRAMRMPKTFIRVDLKACTLHCGNETFRLL